MLGLKKIPNLLKLIFWADTLLKVSRTTLRLWASTKLAQQNAKLSSAKRRWENTPSGRLILTPWMFPASSPLVRNLERTSGQIMKRNGVRGSLYFKPLLGVMYLVGEPLSLKARLLCPKLYSYLAWQLAASSPFSLFKVQITLWSMMRLSEIWHPLTNVLWVEDINLSRYSSILLAKIFANIM